jgi:hypothetical protein
MPDADGKHVVPNGLLWRVTLDRAMATAAVGTKETCFSFRRRISPRVQHVMLASCSQFEYRLNSHSLLKRLGKKKKQKISGFLKNFVTWVFVLLFL